MSSRSSLLLVGTVHGSEAALVARLGSLFEVATQPTFSDAVADVLRLKPDVVAVDLRANASLGVTTIDKLHRARAELVIVALSTDKDPDLILSAMRAGAREFVVTQDPAELGRVFGAIAAQLRERRPGGAILSVFAAKGGLGATVVAANLAGALREGDKRVVLVDLDLQLGDALVFLDLACRYSITDVLANQHRLDGDLLASSLTRHASGLFVLSQPELGQDEPTPADISKLLAFLAQHFDYVVCDGLRRFDDRAVAALDASDRIVLLVVQNVPAIRNAHRALEVFRRLGYATSKISVVVNRFVKNDEIGPQDVSQNLGLPIAATLSNDYRSVMGAVNKGQLLQDTAPRAKVTEDVRRLAHALSGAAQGKHASGGLLRTLFGAKAREKEKETKEKEAPRHGVERPTEAL